jgi:hypothetical protein
MKTGHPSLFTEVPVLSPESERSCICVLGISNLPISTIFLLNFWNFSDSVIFFFHFIIGCEKRIMIIGPPKEILPGEPKKGPWISEVPHGLSHWRFILICSLFFWYFQFKATIFREVSACPQAPKQNMPAASATAKMSFSVLRRLKTCVSSAMKNDRLFSLALMHIHRDYEVDTGCCIKGNIFPD